MAFPKEVATLLENSWHKVPEERPDFSQVGESQFYWIFSCFCLIISVNILYLISNLYCFIDWLLYSLGLILLSGLHTSLLQPHNDFVLREREKGERKRRLEKSWWTKWKVNGIGFPLQEKWTIWTLVVGLLFHLNVFIFHFVYRYPCSLFIIFVVIYMQIVEDLETLIESQKAAQKDGGSPVHPHHHHTCCATCSFVSPTGSTTPPDSSQNTDSELSGRMPFLVLL